MNATPDPIPFELPGSPGLFRRQIVGDPFAATANEDATASAPDPTATRSAPETPEQREERYRAAVERAATLPTSSRGPAIDAIKAEFGVHKATISSEIRKASSHRESPLSGKVKAICLATSVALSTRVREILGVAASMTYVTAGELFRANALGSLTAYEPDAFAVAIDDPRIAEFFTVDGNGNQVKTSLSRSEATFALAAVVDATNPNSHCYIPELRPVVLQTPAPVAYKKEDGSFAVATGYNRDLQILAGNIELKMGMTISEAVAVIDRFVGCYDAATPGDRNRLRAAIISPALAASNLLPANDMESKTPLLWLHKDQAGAGSSYIVNALGEVYNQDAYPIDVSNKSGRLEESVATAVKSATQVIQLDNVSSKTDLSQYENIKSLITNLRFAARTPYAGEVVIDVSKRVVVGTSNGAHLGPEFTTRCLSIKLLYKSLDKYPKFAEGSLKQHIRTNRGEFLGAIFTLLAAYNAACLAANKPMVSGTRVVGHRFSNWESAMSWIIENCFWPSDKAARRETVGLMDGQDEANTMMSDPMVDRVLSTFRGLTEGENTRGLLASSIAQKMLDSDLVKNKSIEQLRMPVAACLRRLFPKDGQHRFAGGELYVRVTTYGSGSNEHRLYQAWPFRLEAPAIPMDNRRGTATQTVMPIKDEPRFRNQYDREDEHPH